MAVKVVGVLLIFALLVTPAAVANNLTRKPPVAMLISAALSLSATIFGLIIAFYVSLPVSFIIISIVFAEYLLVLILKRYKLL
jgi:zinc/manganese transport system permease protein